MAGPRRVPGIQRPVQPAYTCISEPRAAVSMLAATSTERSCPILTLTVTGLALQPPNSSIIPFSGTMVNHTIGNGTKKLEV